MVGKGQQVHCHPTTPAGHARKRIDARGDGRENGMAGCILGVDDPADAVAALPREIQPAGIVAIERDVKLVE